MTSMLNYPKGGFSKGVLRNLWNKQLMLSAIIVFAGVFVLSSCGGDDKPKSKPVTVTSLSVTEGLVGTTVTVTGTNFDAVPANNKVFFGEKEAKVTGGTTTMLTTKVPVGAATGYVYVQVGTGAKIKGPMFTVKQKPVTVTVTSLSVTEGFVGTTVTVTGTNFDAMVANNKVFFGEKQAEVTGGTTTMLTTKVPVGAATDYVYVQVGPGVKIRGPMFTVLVTTVTSLSVTEGPVGTTVTVNGTNFDAMVANNKVFFGEKEAEVTAATTTMLTTKVPVGATTGYVYVQVGTGTKIKGPMFTVKQNRLTIDLKGVNNDAEEGKMGGLTETGTMNLTSSDLELGDKDDGPHRHYQLAGTRFMNIAIPKGSVITKAYIQFSADDYGNSPLKMKIWGEKEDTGEFTSALKNISSRMKTTAAVIWEVPEWTEADVNSNDKTKFRGPKQATADLKTIVQEIIDGTNWNSGGNMTFIFDIESDVNSAAFKAGIRGREVETWSEAANTAGTSTNLSEAAASLIIEFR